MLKIGVKLQIIPPNAQQRPAPLTKTAKPRVVYDGAATAGGESLNRAVLAGENLLNGLVNVLMHFRMEKYACVADVSKCFFQIKLPQDQQDWFHIIWFKDNNIDSGEIQIFRFTRHVWGINSSPYVALMALSWPAADHPTHASMVTLNAITQNRHMDDLLFAGNTLSDVETFAKEGIELFESRGFKLRRWVTNGHTVLLWVPQCDHALMPLQLAGLTLGRSLCRIQRRWAFPGTQKVSH